MKTFFVTDGIEAVDPHELSEVPGIIVQNEGTSRGIPQVRVLSEDRDALIAYCRQEWGDDDQEWFDRHVVGGIRTITPKGNFAERLLEQAKAGWVEAKHTAVQN